MGPRPIRPPTGLFWPTSGVSPARHRRRTLQNRTAARGVVKTAVVPQWLRHGGDDAWSDERAADPLHCPWIDSEPFGNDAHTGPPRSRQGLTDSLFKRGGNWGAPEPLAFTPGPRKPGTDSFRNHRPLKFGEHA